MPIPIFQVDAFASRPFRGNPAAVCLLEEPAGEEWMQLVAAEMNLAETAFVHPGEDGFGLRWFTPRCEVELCGHATLAAAFVLWEDRRCPAGEEIVFHTLSGALRVKREGDWLAMDFPAEPAARCTPPIGLTAALDAPVTFLGRNRMDFLIEVESAADLREMEPDLDVLGAIEARGFIVTALGDDGEHDFLSRFFAPAVGLAEDPVTGSAHCCLAPYWSEKLGKDTLVGYQCSERGGTVAVRCLGERVELRGRAAMVLKGELRA